MLTVLYIFHVVEGTVSPVEKSVESVENHPLSTVISVFAPLRRVCISGCIKGKRAKEKHVMSPW